MGFVYFYDLPVYRLQREAYYEARDKHIEDTLFPSGTVQAELTRKMAESNPDSLAAFRGHLERSYGGCWEFNEIIGYIRLHFLGTQVRGEYYASPKKRIVRTRKKLFEYQTWKLAPETDIEAPYSNVEILAAIREYISDCRHELPRRYIDASVFEAIADHVNWAALLRGNNA